MQCLQVHRELGRRTPHTAVEPRTAVEQSGCAGVFRSCLLQSFRALSSPIGAASSLIAVFRFPRPALHRRPRVIGSYRGDNDSDAGGPKESIFFMDAALSAIAATLRGLFIHMSILVEIIDMM